MKDHTITMVKDLNLASNQEGYEVIENEVLTHQNQEDLSLSGACLRHSEFRQVTFRNCLFFGTKLTSCTFVGCVFINCSFQFSEIEGCNFSATRFENCHWQSSPLTQTSFSYCQLDHKTAYHLGTFRLHLEHCYGGAWSSPGSGEKAGLPKAS